jgi:hypothetical protein
LDSFRTEWICGHLDCQRATEALEALRDAARRLGAADASDEEAVRHAEQNVEKARRRLADVKALHARQFDRFCGLSE